MTVSKCFSLGINTSTQSASPIILANGDNCVPSPPGGGGRKQSWRLADQSPKSRVQEKNAPSPKRNLLNCIIKIHDKCTFFKLYSVGEITTLRVGTEDGNYSSQSPSNALDISCSPYKTYNYEKYIKI
jgi:hypothetical protein